MTNSAQEQAQAQLRSIIDLVKAYELDWDHLEAMKDDRDFLKKEELYAELIEWDEEHGGDLEELQEAAGDFEDQELVREAMLDNALSVETRTDWSTNTENSETAEFRIVVMTGGGHVEVVGELDQYGQPDRAWIQYQDWGTPMTRLLIGPEEHADLLTYCNVFYFGE